MSKLKSALAALLLLTTPAFADESESVPTLPEGQVELADLAGPYEIWQELLQNPSENDFYDANPTAKLSDNHAGNYRLNIVVHKYTGSPRLQTLYVIEDGMLTDEWLVSTGLGVGKKINTPPGLFKIDRMEYEWYSTVWDNAPMHRAIFFNGGIALHATYGGNIAKLGRRDSGGCIRQHPDNAEKLWNLVKKYGPRNTLIIVRD